MPINIVIPVQLQLGLGIPKSQRHIKPAPPDEARICEICFQSFFCKPREWAHTFRKRRTCGRRCGSLFAGRKRRYLLEHPCGYCGKVFKQINTGDKYCSRQCYWESKKGKPATYIPPRAPRIEVTCPTCGTIHLRGAWEIKKVFCSRNCYTLMRRSKVIGTRFPYVGQNDFYLSGAWSRLKRLIKKRDNFNCQACQRSFKPTSPGMIVHHIRPRHLWTGIGATLHTIADQPSNLVLLCRSCHQKVHSGHFPHLLDLS